MNMKSILKSFEIFFRLPMSIFHRKFIHIIHIDNKINVFNKKYANNSIKAELHNSGVQINVTNNLRMYSLLSNVIRKKNEKQVTKPVNFCKLTANKEY